MARRYRLTTRAAGQAKTKRRIVEAALALHERKGLLATTVTDIADLADVGRQTFYRHFPNELALTQACSGLYWERHPPPDPDDWRDITRPRDRAATALRASYAYHRRTAPMIARLLAEASEHPVMAGYHAHWRHAAEVVTDAWPLRGRQRKLLRAGVGHALVFGTWQSLTRGQGLSDTQAVEVAMGFVAASSRC